MAKIRQKQIAPVSLVAGTQASSVGTFTRVGSVTTTSNGTAVLQLELLTSDPLNTAEARLFNVTDNAVVAGSTLSTTSTVGAALSASLVLPTASKTYDLQLRLTTSDPAARAACDRATLEVP